MSAVKPPRRLRARPLLMATLSLAASLALGACNDEPDGGGNVFPDSGPDATYPDSGNPFFDSQVPDGGTD